MTAYEHLTALDDPAKPHRRVWRCASGVHVKTHARLRRHELGRLDWRITGALCDEAGKALARGDGYAVQETPHVLVLLSDGDMTPEARAAYIARELDAALLIVVRQVEAAALNEAAAERLSGQPVTAAD